MSEQQLERSVLEAKEREELFAIAEALGTQPVTRARKSDLIGAILRATGVDVGDEPAPPRRTRARKTPSTTATAAASAGPGDPGASTLDFDAAPVGSASADATPASSTAAGSTPPSSTPPSPTPSSPAPDGSPRRGEPAAADGADARRRTLDQEGTADSGNGSDVAESSPATGATGAPQPAPAAGAPSARADAPSAPESSSTRSSEPFRRSPRSTGQAPAPTPPEGPGGRFERQGGPRPARSGSGPNAGRRAGAGAGAAGNGLSREQDTGAARAQQAGNDQHGTGQHGTGQHETGQQGSDEHGASEHGASEHGANEHGASEHGDQSRTGQNGTGQSGTGQPEADQHAAEGADRPRFDNEGGNRRNRRRRGRDRAERPERELPGQGGADAPFVGEPQAVRGFLDLRDEGYGFLRTQGYPASGADVYVSISQARRFSLRRGDWVEGTARPAAATEKYPALLRIDLVSGAGPDEARTRPNFDELEPVYPDQLLALATDDPAKLAVRVMDLFTPMGKGQRALLTGPPKSGKTTIITEVVNSLETQHPELELLVLLLDERPEEVTEVRRAVRSDVIATTFDRPAEEHVQVAELVIERAKRLAESGRDVVVVVDGLTRLARAYNLVPAGTGRVLPGGIDAGALHHPKKFFAAARNIEDGGSLTILATALVDSGSRTDEVIYDELSSTANMELRLDGALAARRIYPAVDVQASSTRHDERLVTEGTLAAVRALRTSLGSPAHDGERAGDEDRTDVASFLQQLAATRTNGELLSALDHGGRTATTGTRRPNEPK